MVEADSFGERTLEIVVADALDRLEIDTRGNFTGTQETVCSPLDSAPEV